MWIPSSWAHLQAMLGQTGEAPGLDFKSAAALGNNREVAKDIAAMTVNGGILLYGVVEDPRTQLAARIEAVRLAGQEERIQQIVGTQIAPVPEVRVSSIVEARGDDHGVLVVTVPASPLAPHWWHERFPARSGTTRRYLEEPEIDRLYRQREQKLGAAPGVGALHGDFRAAPEDPGWPHDGVARIRVVVRPRAADVVHPAGARLYDALRRAVDTARAVLSTKIATHQAEQVLESLEHIRPLGAIGWIVGDTTRDVAALRDAQTLIGVLAYPATWSWQATIPVDVPTRGEHSTYKCAYEWLVINHGLAILAVSGASLRDIPGAALVSVGLWLDGFENAVAHQATHGRPGVWHGGLPAAPGSESMSTSSTASDMTFEPEKIVRDLLDRWLVGFGAERALDNQLAGAASA